MLANPYNRDAIADRENDLQVAERLVEIVQKLANLGTLDQRRGRSRTGQFVAKPPAVESQLSFENALLAVAKRIETREA